MQQWLRFTLDMARERADEEGRTIEFSFTADQVQRLYTLKNHPAEFGDGLWFQVKNGRIFNCTGQQDKARKACFSRAIEGQEAQDIAAFVITELTAGR